MLNKLFRANYINKCKFSHKNAFNLLSSFNCFKIQNNLVTNIFKSFSAEVQKPKLNNKTSPPIENPKLNNKTSPPIINPKLFIPRYIPIEKQTKKQRIQARAKKRAEKYYYYGNKHFRDPTKLYPVWEAYAKKKRLGYLNSTYLPTKDFNMKVKRYRSCHESILDLTSKGEVAVSIAGREEFPELNFILDLKTLYRLLR